MDHDLARRRFIPFKYCESVHYEHGGPKCKHDEDLVQARSCSHRWERRADPDLLNPDVEGPVNISNLHMTSLVTIPFFRHLCDMLVRHAPASIVSIGLFQLSIRIKGGRAGLSIVVEEPHREW